MGLETFDVYCKLPHGLVLQRQREQVFQEPVPGGGMRDVKRMVKTGETFTVKGVARRRELSEDAPMMVAGFAVTKGIPADFWETWKAQNKGLEALEKGFIYAVKKAADGAARAKDVPALTGFEPAKVGDLPAEFRNIKEDDRK